MWNLNNELKDLLMRIENLREELHYNVKQGKSLIDPFIIKLSQNLDTEINKYYRIMKDNEHQIKTKTLSLNKKVIER